MRRICPEVDEQETRCFGGALAHTPKHLQVLLDVERVHDVGDHEGVVAVGNRVSQKVALDDRNPPLDRRAFDLASRDGRGLGQLVQRTLDSGVALGDDA